jgi:biopolymer transport protein ExbD
MPAPDPQKVSSKGQRTVADFESDADYLIVRIDQDDAVWVEDQEMPSEQDLLVKLRETLDKAQAPRRMLVLGNGDARHATVVRVLDAGNEVGLEDVRLAIEDEP